MTPSHVVQKSRNLRDIGVILASKAVSMGAVLPAAGRAGEKNRGCGEGHGARGREVTTNGKEKKEPGV